MLQKKSNKRKKTLSAFMFISFTIYGVMLVWVILLKMSLNISAFICIRSINLIPFYYGPNLDFGFHIAEIIGNIVIFVPLGFYISYFKKSASLLNKAVMVLAVSVFFEAVQYATGWGVSDITDVITNIAGGMIGMGLFSALRKILRTVYPKCS